MLKRLLLAGCIVALSSASAYAGDWRLSLTVSVPYTGAEQGVAKNSLAAGIKQTATDDFDNLWDIPAFFSPGLVTEPLRAYFHHEEYTPTEQFLWRDFRADQFPQQWDLYTQPSEPGVETTLSWSATDLSGLPSSVSVRLMDIDGGGQELDMRSVSVYTYHHEDPTRPHRFQIVVDEPSTSPPPPLPPDDPPIDHTHMDLRILTPHLPTAEVERSYTARLKAKGGVKPYQWKVLEGGLPAGLKLNPDTGKISGWPEHSGSFLLPIQVTDADETIRLKALTLIVREKERAEAEEEAEEEKREKKEKKRVDDSGTSHLRILTLHLPAADVRRPYTAHLKAKGGAEPYEWEIHSEQMPDCLELNPDTGKISGQPRHSGSFPLQIRVTDADETIQLKAFTLIVREKEKKKRGR